MKVESNILDVLYINITLVSKFLLNEKVGNLVNTISDRPLQEKIVNPRLIYFTHNLADEDFSFFTKPRLKIALQIEKTKLFFWRGQKWIMNEKF